MRFRLALFCLLLGVMSGCASAPPAPTLDVSPLEGRLATSAWSDVLDFHPLAKFVERKFLRLDRGDLLEVYAAASVSSADGEAILQ